ncbi:MAG: beta-phosphoglucomutase [Lachnospiraceae bacterium]|nr:beta-phosphoglucomutase [Lachnospiraceae bacterium]
MEKITKIVGLIFDLDGVIVHTDMYHYKAWKKLADRLNIFFDDQINNRLRGVSRMESLEIILENAKTLNPSDSEKEAYATEKNETYKELLKQMTQADLSKDVAKTLYELKERNYRLAIGSSSRNAGLILDKIGLSDFFDAVSDGNNITNSKPDPEVFLKAAEYLGLKAEECIVIEDADAGVEAAHRAGMKAIAMGDAVLHNNGDWNIKNFNEILDILKQL